eukprot:c8612_g1_i3.p3 GENE.c8612_g1_i3~~c8612_g1_i3.p3  ORF type:complete len:110 (-),score=16.74 c8612_g1_i3:515-844(-)
MCDFLAERESTCIENVSKQPFFCGCLCSLCFASSDSKSHMARDDPAFVVLQLAFLLASSVSFTIAYHSFSPAKIVSTIFYTILVDWLLVGVVVSTVCWLESPFISSLNQ